MDEGCNGARSGQGGVRLRGTRKPSEDGKQRNGAGKHRVTRHGKDGLVRLPQKELERKEKKKRTTQNERKKGN